MKTESEFMNEVMEKLNRATTDIHCLVTDKKELEGKAEDKKYYSAQYISETLYPAIKENRYAIQQKQEQISRDIERMIEQQKQDYLALDAVKAEELNDSAIRLLSMDLLTEEELERLFDEFAGNPTMQKIILKMSEKAGKQIKRSFIGHREQIAGLNSLLDVVRIYTNNWIDKTESHEMLKKLFGIR